MLALMAGAGVAIAPLRYGAGVKRKVVQYLAGGIATVTTPVGAQGLWGEGDAGLEPFAVADGVEAWVETIVALTQDAVHRRRLAQGGSDLINRRYAAPVYLDELSGLLTAAQTAHQRRSRG